MFKDILGKGYAPFAVYNRRWFGITNPVKVPVGSLALS